MVDLGGLSFVVGNITLGLLDSKVDNRLNDGLFINSTNWGGRQQRCEKEVRSWRNQGDVVLAFINVL